MIDVASLPMSVQLDRQVLLKALQKVKTFTKTAYVSVGFHVSDTSIALWVEHETAILRIKLPKEYRKSGTWDACVPLKDILGAVQIHSKTAIHLAYDAEQSLLQVGVVSVAAWSAPYPVVYYQDYEAVLVIQPDVFAATVKAVYESALHKSATAKAEFEIVSDGRNVTCTATDDVRLVQKSLQAIVSGEGLWGVHGSHIYAAARIMKAASSVVLSASKDVVKVSQGNTTVFLESRKTLRHNFIGRLLASNDVSNTLVVRTSLLASGVKDAMNYLLSAYGKYTLAVLVKVQPKKLQVVLCYQGQEVVIPAMSVNDDSKDYTFIVNAAYLYGIVRTLGMETCLSASSSVVAGKAPLYITSEGTEALLSQIYTEESNVI